MMSQYDAASTSTPGVIDSLEKLERTPEGQRDRWIQEIEFAEKEKKKFTTQARRVIRRYIDERDAVETNQRWFNIFKTNTDILEASLYANIPEADVSRRFNDMDDDVARVASMVLQRSIMQDMAEPNCDFDMVMRQCVSDRLIPGLGIAWLRLTTETEEQPPEYGTNEDGTPFERIVSQEIALDYVHWEDFLWSPCRVWAERRWVARAVPMTRDALVKRFGAKVGKSIPLDYEPKTQVIGDANTPRNMLLKRARIYEIWDREKKEVVWLSRGHSELLEVLPDPLGLENFEPCPMPMLANLTTSNCIPKPDYMMIQDQYVELDEVNNRISLLIIACKVVGVYDRSAEGVQRMLTEGYDNTLIPVDNWAMFAEKGGVKGQIDWLPLDVVIQALAQLQTHREAIKAQIYELTGISDIVRGSSKASETLGAQQLKSKYASVRIQRLQDEVVRFAEDILRIKAEILLKHFDPNILLKMANVQNMAVEDQQLVPQALQLLKAPAKTLQWRVEIASDAMAIIDYNQQKTERTEFLNAVATFLQSASTVGQGSPQLIPLMLQLLKFGVAGFRVSREIEGIFDRYMKEFEQQIEAQKNAPPQPSPEETKMQMEMRMKQEDQQLKQQGQQADLAMKQQEQQADLQMQAQEHQMKLAQMSQEFQLKLDQMQQEFALKMELSAREAEIKREAMALDANARAAATVEKDDGDGS
jgi:uncharacterized protein (UPF0335 family)